MKKRYIILEIIVLLIIIGIGVTFAYLSISKNQELTNNFTTGCLNIEIENISDAINIENAVSKSDLNGLKEDGYTFTIHNTCTTSANYEINLEELSDPSNENTLNANYLKVALSSDTFDNIITKLGENTEVTKYINNSYKAYNLYNGTISGGATKEFTLKEWIDYDVTKEEGLNKSIKTKINVISGTNKGKEIIPSEISEIKFDNTTGTIIGETTNIKYCTSKDNECVPDIDITAKSNKIEVTITGEESKKIVATSLGNLEVNVNSEQIICTAINENKTICSNPINIEAAHFTGLSCSGACVLSENGIYEAEDNDGTSYYFRGTVENNYVKFGKMGDANNPGEDIWWRIIRINGDGSIRMIYAGTSTNGKPPSVLHGSTVIKMNYQYAFTYSPNGEHNDNKYVGFEYRNEVRNGKGEPSNAKIILETWFEANLKDELEAENSKIDKNAGFCADRSAYSSKSANSRNDDNLGTGDQVTYYGAYIRNYPNGRDPGTNNPAHPSLECQDIDNDLFTYEKSNKGTRSLTYPIGLITADEVIYAGVNMSNSYYNYIFITYDYWTMSPCEFDGRTSSVLYVSDTGGVTKSGTYGTAALRPVLNLSSNSIIYGTGTSTDPYRTV